MRSILVIRFLFSIMLLSAIVWGCNDEDNFPSATDLSFSTDTLIFDTVFTSLGSITKRFKVYNKENRIVNIDNIRLAGGPDSPFDIVFNGKDGDTFPDNELLSKDSILVLVSVTIDPADQNLPFIVKDSVVFESGGKTWDIDLVAWGQDAHFLSDSILVCNTNWVADRPYVIYNSILVDTLCTLSIDPGVKIYSHNGSSIFVKGAVNAIGTAEDRILFTNDRFDEGFVDAAGQWEGIYFLEGSNSNQFSFVDIRNSIMGLRLGTPDEDDEPDVVISESSIENMTGYGILAFTSDLHATNVLINNCRLAAVANVAGGNYTYQNCTFANYPKDFLFDGPTAVFSNNILLEGNGLLEGDLSVDIINSVVWGFGVNEIELSESNGTAFSVSVEYSLLKTDKTIFSINNNIINTDPLFENPMGYLFGPLEGSPLIGSGKDIGNTIDLNGKSRPAEPTIGAIEF